MMIFEKHFLIALFLTCAVDIVIGAKAENKIQFSETEKSWLRAHPVIRVAPDPDFPPIEWFDMDGKLVGLAADYLELVESFFAFR